MKRKWRIAVQNQGRMRAPALEFLRRRGVDFNESDALVIPCDNTDLEIIFVRNGDIPTYVEKGAADFGIVGENVLFEQDSKLPVVERLGFCRCSLVLAVPEQSGLRCLEDLEGERIATSYPNSLKKYLREKRINAAVIEINGSVEIAPGLNLADAICDITQTGKTLEENGLKVLGTVLESEAVLVSSFHLTQNHEKVLFSKIGQAVA